MAHTLTNFELEPDNTPVEMLWNLLEFYEQPIKLLLYKYGLEMVKKYFYYDYCIYQQNLNS